jgi:hypothetical protein
MIYIFVLYVGIIAAIQEHTYDYFHGRMSGHVYIYPNPMGHTLKSFASIKYEFGIRSREREAPKVVQGSLGMVPLYHGWFQKDPNPYR